MTFKIFLVGLSVHSTEQEILSFFRSKYAKGVTKVTLKSNKAKNSRNGCGILELSCKDTYSSILAHRKFSYKGRNFFANIYLKGSQLNKFKTDILKRRVFISCLKASFSDAEIRTIFSKFGSIDDAFLIRKSHGAKSKYGYVMFSNESSAKKAIKVGTLKVSDNTIVISPFKNKNFKEDTKQGKKEDKSSNQQGNEEHKILTNIRNQNIKKTKKKNSKFVPQLFNHDESSKFRLNEVVQIRKKHDI